MLISVDLLSILRKANQGCPKCQYIMADRYFHGIDVPKSHKYSRIYYEMMLEHSDEELEFTESERGCFYIIIAYQYLKEKDHENSWKFFSKAVDYYRNNYPLSEAEKILEKDQVFARLKEIEYEVA